jgi:redox-sensitive bicupin YhaK (pirin superfamily)
VLPVVSGEGKTVRVVAGELFGARAPVKTLWDSVFAEAKLAAGTSLPIDAAYEERALYVAAGEIDVQGDRFAASRLIVFRPGDRMTVTAVTEAHVIIVGGAAMDGPRHIWWNFVSSRKERIEEAKADWKAGRFTMVSGDSEFIPLPEG